MPPTIIGHVPIDLHLSSNGVENANECYEFCVCVCFSRLLIHFKWLLFRFHLYQLSTYKVILICLNLQYLQWRGKINTNLHTYQLYGATQWWHTYLQRKECVNFQSLCKKSSDKKDVILKMNFFQLEWN